MNIIKPLVLLGMAGVLGGCAISSETYLPDGSKGYSISCDGSALSFSQCYEKAGQICKEKGYVVLNKDGEAHGFGYSSGSANVSQAGGNAGYTTTVGAMVNRDLYIKCKE